MSYTFSAQFPLRCFTGFSFISRLFFVLETFDSYSKKKKSLWSEIFDDVKNEVSDGSLTEIGIGILSFQLAGLNANKSVFAALTNGKYCILTEIT